MRHRNAVVCVLTAFLLHDIQARAQPRPAAPPPRPAAPLPRPAAPPLAPPPGVAPTAGMSEDARKEEARKYFEKGLALFDDEAWDGALAEFLHSREIYPGRAATKNAAICLRKVKRFDESLTMFEELLRIPGLTPADRELAEKEMVSLRSFVGVLDIRGAEAGATVIVDGRNRGSAPTQPVRVNVGTHVVRVYKEGFEAFETRIDVPGGQAELVNAKLAPLLRSGRLKVMERQGYVL